MHTVVMSIAFFLFAVAPIWAQQNGGGHVGGQIHGASPTRSNPGDVPGLANALKKSKLAGYPSMTIGAAIDGYRYFAKREWRETAAADGKIFVDFTGWLRIGLFDVSAMKDGISARAVGIKFVVNPDGSYGAVMASRIENKTDGKVYVQPVENLKDILGKIYANKEILF